MSLTEEEQVELRRLVEKKLYAENQQQVGMDAGSPQPESQPVKLPDKANFLELFNLAFGATVYDPGELFNARIRIDDFSSAERKKEPYAYVFHDDYANPLVLVERINILQSIRNDAAFVGHPIAVFAIEHWERILLTRNQVKRQVYDLFKDNRVRNAERNLEKIGAAILAGIKRRTISTEKALTLEVERLRLFDKNNYVYFAWVCLSNKTTARLWKVRFSIDQRIEAIRNELSQPVLNFGFLETFDYGYSPGFGNADIHDPRTVFNHHTTLDSVIDFMKTSGRHFVKSKETTTRLQNADRQAFKVFARAFASWYLHEGLSTIDKYARRSKEEPPEKVLHFPASPFAPTEGRTIFQIVKGVLAKCPMAVGDPVLISQTEARDFEMQFAKN